MLWLRCGLRNRALNVKLYGDANFRTFRCQKLNALAARANFEIFHGKSMSFNCKFSHENLSYALKGTMQILNLLAAAVRMNELFSKNIQKQKKSIFSWCTFWWTYEVIWLLACWKSVTQFWNQFFGMKTCSNCLAVITLNAKDLRFLKMQTKFSNSKIRRVTCFWMAQTVISWNLQLNFSTWIRLARFFFFSPATSSQSHKL